MLARCPNTSPLATGSAMQPQPAPPPVPVYPATNSGVVEEIIRELHLISYTLDLVDDDPPVVELIMEHLGRILIMIHLIDHQ